LTRSGSQEQAAIAFLCGSSSQFGIVSLDIDEIRPPHVLRGF
jgi:hypothetical protein